MKKQIIEPRSNTMLEIAHFITSAMKDISEPEKLDIILSTSGYDAAVDVFDNNHTRAKSFYIEMKGKTRLNDDPSKEEIIISLSNIPELMGFIFLLARAMGRNHVTTNPPFTDGGDYFPNWNEAVKLVDNTRDLGYNQG